METNILFEKILNSFLLSTGDNYFFLSEKLIVSTNEVSKEILIELKDKGFTPLPHRSKEFDSKVKESFVYEITDTKIAEKFFEAVTFKTPKKTFTELLTEFNMGESYKNFERKMLSDTLINWIVKNNISLSIPIPIPKIEINEVNAKTIPDEMKSLTPIICKTCGNDNGFEVKYYKITPSCDNMLMEEVAIEQLKALGIENFNFLGETKKELISTAFCKACKSNDINWDFR